MPTVLGTTYTWSWLLCLEFFLFIAVYKWNRNLLSIALLVFYLFQIECQVQELAAVSTEKSKLKIIILFKYRGWSVARLLVTSVNRLRYWMAFFIQSLYNFSLKKSYEYKRIKRKWPIFSYILGQSFEMWQNTNKLLSLQIFSL